MRSWSNIFEFVIPFKHEDLRMPWISHPSALINKKSRVPIKTI